MHVLKDQGGMECIFLWYTLSLFTNRSQTVDWVIIQEDFLTGPTKTNNLHHSDGIILQQIDNNYIMAANAYSQ